MKAEILAREIVEEWHNLKSELLVKDFAHQLQRAKIEGMLEAAKLIEADIPRLDQGKIGQQIAADKIRARAAELEKELG